MTTVINPEIRVRVETIFDDVWDSAEESVRLDIEIEVTKDLSGDPNQAVIRIYNLNDETVSILAAGGVPNVEVWFNTYGQSELTSCFVGEIVNCYTTEDHPGSCTNLICESQTSHARDKYVNLNYESGTAFSLVVNDLTDAIGLAVQSVTIPDRNILSAMTLTGPAFINLQSLLKIAGMFAYIVDGVLYISSVFEPPVDTVVEITKAMLTAQPQPTTRRDVRDLWYTLSLNNSDAASHSENFTVNRGKVKALTKQQAMDKNKTVVQVDAVDTDILGRSFEMHGLPNLQPDTIVHIEDDPQYYRVQRFQHRGDNHDGVLTSCQSDVFGGH